MAKLVMYFMLFSILTISCNCFNPKMFNVSKTQTGTSTSWSDATATWYGSANGGGSTGGACGYTDSVEKPPFSLLISAGASSLFNSGKGCGACYQVKCSESSNALCSGNPVTVVITDECPAGGVCSSDPYHFDLSGTSFGNLAAAGKAGQLRDAGELKIQYQRVDCNWGTTPLTFTVDSGSSPYYFAVAIKYVGGEGTLSRVQLKQGSNGTLINMVQSWGVVYKADVPAPGLSTQEPISIILTDDAGRTLTATDVIPATWKPAGIYTTSVTSFV